MWVITTEGFFSIVKDRDGGGLLVRARVQADLEGLLEREREVIGRHLPKGSKFPEVNSTPMADYPFRVVLPSETVADILWLAARRIDYPNFKSAVGTRQGFEREGLLHRVWAVLRDLERENPLRRDEQGFEVFSDQGGEELSSPGDVETMRGIPEGGKTPKRKSRKRLKSGLKRADN